MQQENKLKLCSECKFFDFPYQVREPICTKSPIVVVNRDYVYLGDVYEHLTCKGVRQTSEQCGHEGRWFEQKEEEPKKTFWVKIKEWASKPATNFGPG